MTPYQPTYDTTINPLRITVACHCDDGAQPSVHSYHFEGKEPFVTIEARQNGNEVIYFLTPAQAGDIGAALSRAGVEMQALIEERTKGWRL